MPFKRQPLLLLPVKRKTAGMVLSLPKGTLNIFERIIRDPLAPHRPARERLCSELLCGMLISAPTLRFTVLAMLADIAGLADIDVAGLDWQFDTECAIGNKRDDLRIEGWTQQGAASQTVLWTVEIKVAAPLHVSSALFDDDSVSEPEPSQELTQVSQLSNYDAWLSKQNALHRIGFVLSVDNLSKQLPTDLQMPWFSITWTELAKRIEVALADSIIPIEERVLAEHFAGFIESHLWSESHMSIDRLAFDDLAFLRALGVFGPDCFRKTMRLVTGLEDVIREIGIPFTNITQQRAFDGPSARTILIARFLQESKGGPMSPMLCAGIAGGEVRIWLESSPRSPAKKHFTQIAARFIDSLKMRNAAWEAFTDVTSWPDLLLAKPLDFLLLAPDQEIAIKEFARAAIEDMRVTGVLDELKTSISQLASK